MSTQPPATGGALVVLDRDGVINRDSADFIKCADEWQALPGSLAAIARLCRAGYRVVIASNQSGVGRGLITPAALAEIDARMRAAIESSGGRLAGVWYCPHRPDAGCACRKPRPGLLEQIGAHFGCPMTGVPVVGDSLRDIEAARAVGARPILVRTGNGARSEAQRGEGVIVCDDLAAVADLLCAEQVA